MSSELVLYGLLPPLLYAAALSTSLLDVRTHRAAILSLSVGLVLFTAVGVGIVAWLLLPIPFALAVALGASSPRRMPWRPRRGAPDRPAAQDHDDPRGRVAAQRRDGPGVTAHRWPPRASPRTAWCRPRR